jgi:hypothetical protein
MVVLKVQLVNNPDAVYEINSGTTLNCDTIYPRLWYAPDYNDDTNISLDNMKELGGVKSQILQPNTSITIVIKPAILGQTYCTTTTTGYAPKWNTWIDCANHDVPHYGIKMAIDHQGYTLVSPYKIHIEPKYYISCKDTR